MAADDSILLLTFGFEQEVDDKIFARWLPLQGVISYDEFKDGLIRRTVLKSNKEIMEDVNKIIMATVREENGNI